jgi:hypothetical protein
MDQPQRQTSCRAGLGREFNKLWAASAASNLGDGVTLVAAPLLAAALTRDPLLVAGLTFTQRLPWIIFPLLSGVLADRLNQQHAMVAVAIWRSTLIAALGLAVLFDQASIPLLYVIFFLLSTGETLFDISSATLVPTLVHSEQLPSANARLAGTMTVTNQFVGPPLGGASFGLHTMVWGALLVSLRQQLTPNHLRGRVESVYRLLEHGAAAPGALIGGVLAAQFGLTMPFWFGAMTALLLVPLFWPAFSQQSINRARSLANVG